MSRREIDDEADALEVEDDVALVLPYPSHSPIWRLATGHGRCIQGVNGRSTHRGTLAYSFDFKLAVGTPVLAARSGVIAAVVTHFSSGGTKASLAPRANFIAVRHGDGTYARYYHLRHRGADLTVGDSVRAGEQIAWSGNTGFTGGPHLHFDTVNCLPEETSQLKVTAGKFNGRKIASVAAAFSAELALSCDDFQGMLKFDSKPDDLFKGCFALADRTSKQSFAARIESLAARGARAAIIVNNKSGPEVFSMGGCERPSRIPAVLIAKEDGIWLKQQLQKDDVILGLGAHPAVAGVKTTGETLKEKFNGDEPLSFKYGSSLWYVARTLPVEFEVGERTLVPEQANVYPPPQMSACCMPSTAHRRRRRAKRAKRAKDKHASSTKPSSKRSQEA